LIRQLEVGLSQHVAEQRLRRKKGERERPLRVWRALLAALRSAEREREAPIRYRGMEETPRGISFSLTEEPSEEVVGELRLVECVDGGRLTGEVVGVGKDSLTLRPTSGRFEALPGVGDLRVDLRASRSARRRQELALDALQYERSLRPDLRELLLDPSAARVPKPANGLRWRQRELDEPKRQAVAAALDTEDLLLVEGPPGTGKTTFITELVLQALEQDPQQRILVSSQTNAALDNVLERLAKLDPALRLLRVARREDDRVAHAVEPFRLERQIETWREQVIQDGRQWLADWAEARDISVREVEIAMRLEELAAEHDALARLREERSQVDQELKLVRDQSGRPGTTDSESEAALVGRQLEISEELASATSGADEAIARLVELEVARRARARPGCRCYVHRLCRRTWVGHDRVRLVHCR
jgi:hypothetical protein